MNKLCDFNKNKSKFITIIIIILLFFIIISMLVILNRNGIATSNKKQIAMDYDVMIIFLK